LKENPKEGPMIKRGSRAAVPLEHQKKNVQTVKTGQGGRGSWGGKNRNKEETKPGAKIRKKPFQLRKKKVHLRSKAKSKKLSREKI